MKFQYWRVIPLTCQYSYTFHLWCLWFFQIVLPENIYYFNLSCFYFAIFISFALNFLINIILYCMVLLSYCNFWIFTYQLFFIVFPSDINIVCGRISRKKEGGGVQMSLSSPWCPSRASSAICRKVHLTEWAHVTFVIHCLFAFPRFILTDSFFP